MNDVRINKSALMNDKEAADYAERLEHDIPAIRRGEGGPLTSARDQAVLLKPMCYLRTVIFFVLTFFPAALIVTVYLPFLRATILPA
jgi:hypothetical protein